MCVFVLKCKMKTSEETNRKRTRKSYSWI